MWISCVFYSQSKTNCATRRRQNENLSIDVGQFGGHSSNGSDLLRRWTIHSCRWVHIWWPFYVLMSRSVGFIRKINYHLLKIGDIVRCVGKLNGQTGQFKIIKITKIDLEKERALIMRLEAISSFELTKSPNNVKIWISTRENEPSIDMNRTIHRFDSLKNCSNIFRIKSENYTVFFSIFHR